MTLQLKNKKWRIVYVISFLLFSFTGNAAIPEEPEEEILFVTSYNSDTKYTYDNINTFVETYRQLGGKYSTIVENMNVTDLNQSRKWKKRLTNILDKHPNAKLVILLGGGSVEQFPAPRRREVQTTARILRYGIAQRHPYSGRLY